MIIADFQRITGRNLRTSAIIVHSHLWLWRRGLIMKFHAFVVSLVIQDIVVMASGIKSVIFPTNHKFDSCCDSCY